MSYKEKRINVRERLLKDIVREALHTIREGGDGETNAEYIYGEVLLGKAADGDLKAIDQITKLAGEEEPTKIESTSTAKLSVVTNADAFDLIRAAIEDNAENNPLNQGFQF